LPQRSGGKTVGWSAWLGAEHDMCPANALINVFTNVNINIVSDEVEQLAGIVFNPASNYFGAVSKGGGD
jgi:hypothetical protein